MSEFTSEELTPFLCLLLTISIILISNYRKGYQAFWSPLTIVALVFGYYCVVGPYEAITSGLTFDRVKNMRPFYEPSLWGAFVMLIAIIAGFNFNKKTARIESNKGYSDDLLLSYGKAVFLIGFLLFTISTGGNVTKLINSFDAGEVESVGGSFANYLALCVNFMIPGVSLLFAYYVKTCRGLIWFISSFIIAIGIFTTLGFRYRIVLLVLSMAISFYYLKKKLPNLIVLGISIFIFVVVMGIINISRQYGRGLDITRLENKSTENYYQSGLREAMIFQTSGAVIKMVPENYDYTGMKMIWSTILFPIPSAIYTNKNSAEYLLGVLDKIYGKKYSKGAAMMAYGEYYLSFGWLGIVLGGFLIGYLFKRLWVWYQLNAMNPIVIVVYAVTVSYLYFIISRGYLPLIGNLFLFSVFPIYVVLRFARKRTSIIGR